MSFVSVFSCGYFDPDVNDPMLSPKSIFTNIVGEVFVIIMFNRTTLVDPGFSFRGPGQAPKAQVSRRRRCQGGWSFGRGMSRSPMGEGSGSGLCPLPRKFLDFLPWNGAFCVHSDT